MTERAVRFGEAGQLVGILTAPAQPRAACVLVNGGIVPKHGPFRLYTELARHLATTGIATLRFDLGGIGDSQQGQTSLPLAERTRDEIRAAVDHVLATHPTARLVVGGLCSGAEDAFSYAEHDARVTDVVMIDPFSFRTGGWHWRNRIYRATRRALRSSGIYVPATLHKETKVVKYEYLTPPVATRILDTLLARDTQSHFIYCGRENFNHRGQLAAMFPQRDFRDRVTLDHFPSIDHTQLLADDRETIIAAIAQRLA